RSPTRSSACSRPPGSPRACPRTAPPCGRSYGTLRALRRAIPLLAGLAALATALPVAAQPRVRAGTIRLLTPAASRVRVVVSLRLPPLALAQGHGLASSAARRKLDVRTVSARAYVHREEAAQAAAVATLHAAIPQARVGRRFQVVLDALTVSLPASKLPKLMRQRWAARV